MLVKEAKEIAAISNRNSKMPGSTYAQDSFACKVGSRLAQVKGSVCEGCYARRIQKMRPSVHKGWTRNYESFLSLVDKNPDQWVAACVFQINRMALKSGEMFHRWFDSGDLDSVAQLDCIVKVAKQTPNVSHWLPTRELAIVKKWKQANGDFPSNLVIRISSPMVGDAPLSWPNTSTVHRKDSKVYGHECPAPKQGNACGDCRACWNQSVSNVSYKKH